MANFIPRAEHPNPQFERENWLNLNGEWEFEIDNSVSGRERGLQHAEHLKSKIIVPFRFFKLRVVQARHRNKRK